MDVRDSEFGEQPPELVLHDIGERANDEERRRGIGCLRRAIPDQGSEAGILTLRERGLDARSRIVEDADRGRVLLRQPLGRAGEIQLDHLGRAGADEEEQPDVRAPLQEAGDHRVELVVGIGQPREILFLQDRGGEARLGEDHHPGGRLQEMRAGAGPNDQEEGVLDLPVQPHDSGQAAEDLALAAFADHGPRRRIGGRRSGIDRQVGGAAAHAGTPGMRSDRLAPSRAARSFNRNCVALTA